LATPLDPCIEIPWRFLLKFGGVMAIENLKKHLILPLSLFQYSQKNHSIIFGYPN
jgi:hypothetical protein